MSKKSHILAWASVGVGIAVEVVARLIHPSGLLTGFGLVMIALGVGLVLGSFDGHSSDGGSSDDEPTATLDSPPTEPASPVA